MNAREFYDYVCLMRKAQKDYFRRRTPSALNTAKKLEKLIDDEIKRVGDIERSRMPLFDTENNER